MNAMNIPGPESDREIHFMQKYIVYTADSPIIVNNKQFFTQKISEFLFIIQQNYTVQNKNDMLKYARSEQVLLFAVRIICQN